MRTMHTSWITGLWGVALLLLCAQQPSQAWEIAAYAPGSGPSSEVVRSLAETPDGRIWMACWGSGVCVYDGWQWAHFGVEEGLPSLDVRCVLADRLGGVWALTPKGIGWFDGARWHAIHHTIAGENEDFFNAAELPDGALWFTLSSGRILEFRRSGAMNQAPASAPSGMRPQPIPSGEWSICMESEESGGQTVRALLVRSNGQVWAGLGRGGVAVWDQGRWTRPWVVEMGEIKSMIEAADGKVWAADSARLFCFDKGQWSPLALKYRVEAVFERVPGELWAGAQEGLFVGGGTQWTPVALHEEMPHPRISAFLRARDGSLWVGAYFGAARILPSRWNACGPPADSESLVSTTLYADTGTPPVACDMRGRLYQFDGKTWQHKADVFDHQNPLAAVARQGDHWWVSSAAQLACYSFSKNTVVERIPVPDGKPFNGFFELGEGHLLAHTASALYEWLNGAWQRKEIDHVDGAAIESSALDRDGSVWIGNGALLEQWKHLDGSCTRVQTIRLPSLVRAMANTPEGGICVAIDGTGVFRVANGGVELWARFAGAITWRPSALFCASDGTLWMGGREHSVSAFRNGYWISHGTTEGIATGRVQRLGEYPAGTLWDGVGMGGILRYEPDREAPRVRIPNAPSLVAYHDRGVFNFNAEDRWRLTPADKLLYSWRIAPKGRPETVEWSSFGKETTVLSPSLTPGHYVFEVRASDADHNLSEPPARVDFEVLPAWWGTPSFQVPMGLAAAALGAGAWLLLRKNRELWLTGQQLRAAKELAETASRAKSSFLANVSHEIRTPLNAILGYAQLVSRSAGLDPDQRTYLKAIGSSGEHLLGVIDAVLDMSKIEAGRVILAPCVFDLRRLVADIAFMFSTQCETKQLGWQHAVDPGLPAWVNTDAQRLREILMNLLGNALKFTQNGRVEFNVRLVEPLPSSATEAPVCRLCFEIRDTGPGIDPVEHEAVFESFVRSTENRVLEQGVGLGLAISRQYARLLGGEITLESAIGAGSIFRVLLPVQLADAPPQAEAPAADASNGALLKKGLRVLVADDNPWNRDVLARMLRQAGCSVVCVEDGEGAVAQVQQERPDAVLMDMVMPVMDGCEATRRIKALPGNGCLPVLMVTANALGESRNEALAAGVDGFVCKPFRFEELLEELRKVTKGGLQ